MLRLRLAHEAGNEGDPRRAMVALASQFPGALREIDELPLPEIHARVDALRSAEQGRTAVATWMEATVLFHAFTRGVLCAKRWLAGRKQIDADTKAAFEAESEKLCYADEARAWVGELDRVANPPRGRVTDLVYERIAAALRVTPREARILVFGIPRRERQSIGDA
jgi:hypothetical protein